jgi:long-subunit acyl-CoA synthetase (AMP-forming)
LSQPKSLCELFQRTAAAHADRVAPVAIGDRRSYNVALIVLDPDAGAAYAAQQGLPSAAPADLCQDPGVQAIVEAAVAEANGQLSRVEQIKRFRILPVDWQPAGDELTPTMKLKRKPIAAKYADVIDYLYAGEGNAPAQRV